MTKDLSGNSRLTEADAFETAIRRSEVDAARHVTRSWRSRPICRPAPDLPLLSSLCGVPSSNPDTISPHFLACKIVLLHSDAGCPRAASLRRQTSPWSMHNRPAAFRFRQSRKLSSQLEKPCQLGRLFCHFFQISFSSYVPPPGLLSSDESPDSHTFRSCPNSRADW